MTKIAMRRMFNAIDVVPDTTVNFTADDIEKALVENYKTRERITESYENERISENSYDMESEALFEEEEKLREAYKKFYPYAFNEGTMMDEEVYNELNIPFEQCAIITPEDILNATKLSDTDVIYTCKVRTFHNGRFVNNYVQIYLDDNYNERDDIFKEDYNNTCSAIAYAIGHEFVAVLEIKKATNN